MSKSVITRYFSDEHFVKIRSDFSFLIKMIIESGFEYDFQIRDNYFSLYYKGNNLGKVSYRKEDLYQIQIHKKFINDKIKARFKHQEKGNYLKFDIPTNKLKLFFSSNNLLSMGQMVKRVNYQEETTFEQMLITDNVDRTDLIIIDRQIVDRCHPTKMDLLALARKDKNNYQFCIIEVKLGNNPELKGDVIEQLDGYKKRISDNFNDYKNCYEVNFRQKKEVGIFKQSININIVPGVLGVIVVGGYSGIADKNIKELKQKSPHIKIVHLKNIINLSKLI